MSRGGGVAGRAVGGEMEACGSMDKGVRIGELGICGVMGNKAAGGGVRPLGVVGKGSPKMGEWEVRRWWVEKP